MKVTWETKKILGPSIEVQATCARVPVINGHSEAVFLELNKRPQKEILDILRATSGVKLWIILRNWNTQHH